MLKKFFLPLLAGALASITASQALAQIKCAVINTQRAVLETDEMKKAAADMETKFRPRQQEIDKRTQELQQMQEKLQSGRVTGQEATDLQSEGQLKQRQLQRITEDLQADVDRERNDILAKGSKRMTDVVAKLAEEKGLDLVIDANTTLFFKPVLDITADAIAAYNKQYPLK